VFEAEEERRGGEMKAKELAELLLERPEKEVTVSVDISKGEDDAELRAFGNDIIEVMHTTSETVLICTGKTNQELVEGYDKRMLADLKKMWSEACEIARTHCPVDVGRSHLKDGIPKLAKRAADAEAERDKLRAQIDTYKDDRRELEPLHWAFAEYDNFKPLRKVLYEKPEEALMQQMDMKIFEEFSITSIVAKNEELKKRVEVLEMAVEYLNGEKK
jgi:cell division protein FtsB